MSQERVLAAIMFTDIVGYTAMMGKDSLKAMDLVRQSMNIQKPLVKKHHGKWLKEMGDGAMAQFSTALDAVNCALDIQRASRADFEGDLRVGIHLGDITIENNDVYGDGVNLASRLESIADPGGIYISESVEKSIKGQTTVEAKYIGEQTLKNVDYGVRTYALQGVGLPAPMPKGKRRHESGFWFELRKFNVIRVALVYILTAWMFIEIASQLFPAFGIPGWGVSLVIGFWILGLPISLILAWSFELSPDGFIRTVSNESLKNPYSRVRKKPLTSNLSITILIIVVICQQIYFNYWNPGSAYQNLSRFSALEKSIAVLPFDNMSGEEESQHLCDGLTEELIFRLSQIKDFDKVISRTSVMGYRNSNKSIPMIAAELNVATILEGSFRKYGDEVRITVQLINGKTDNHIWSETYSRPFGDIFEIQTEVAQKIATTLQAELTEDEKVSISRKPTDNLEAYNYYLKGKEYFGKWTLGDEDDTLNSNLALQMYDRAIELDPDFVLAFLGKEEVHRINYYFKRDPSQERAGKAVMALYRAQKLDPDHVEVLISDGMHQYHIHENYDVALKLFEAAEKLSPNYPPVIRSKGLIYRRKGQWAKALDAFNRNLELSPLDVQVLDDNYTTLMFMRRYPEADLILRKALDFEPENLRFIFFSQQMDLRWQGQIPSEDVDDYQYHYYNRNFDSLIKIINEEGPIINQAFYYPLSLRLSLAYHLMENPEQSLTYANSALSELHLKLEELKDDHRIYASLGIAYAIAQNNAEAFRHVKESIEILVLANNEFMRYIREVDLARVYTITNYSEQAVEQLEYLLSIPGGPFTLTVEIIKIDPIWDPLRYNIDFQELIENPSYQVKSELKEEPPS